MALIIISGQKYKNTVASLLFVYIRKHFWGHKGSTLCLDLRDLLQCHRKQFFKFLESHHKTFYCESSLIFWCDISHSLLQSKNHWQQKVVHSAFHHKYWCDNHWIVEVIFSSFNSLLRYYLKSLQRLTMNVNWLSILCVQKPY